MLSREKYTVGIICAWPFELMAVWATLDEQHGSELQKPGHNTYKFGRIGTHNVVVACTCTELEVNGQKPAAIVATHMMRSFPIKFGLIVGIGGGVPSKRKDIRLGDLVVSQPNGMHGGLVQYDYGKMERDGVFQKTGTLNKPPQLLLDAVQSVKARHDPGPIELGASLEAMIAKYPDAHFGRPSHEHDELFRESYKHADRSRTCDSCDKSFLEHRYQSSCRTFIHYGTIASSKHEVIDAQTRDRFGREQGILCLETGAVGLMDTFPCVVIRGVYNYADSHGSRWRESWQLHAAAVAALYAKTLLLSMPEADVEAMQPASEAIST